MRQIALWLLVAACGGSKRDEAPQSSQAPVADPLPGSGSSNAADAYVQPKLEFSEDVAPPPPFDRLRPRMKQADALAILGEQHVRPASTVPGYFTFIDTNIYETGQPDVLASLSFPDGRLAAIRIQSYDDRVLTAVRDRWGKPATVDPKSIMGVESAWPTGSSGWTARLFTKPQPADRVVTIWRITELVFEAAAERSGASLAVTAEVFSQLGKLVGQPLATAESTFGPGLRREVADTDEASPERSEARQGFATMTVPWSSSAWELVLVPEKGGEKIASAIVQGPTDDEASRLALFQALRKDFGVEPQAVVSESGRFEIRLVTPALHVRVREVTGDHWAIVITKR